MHMLRKYYVKEICSCHLFSQRNLTMFVGVVSLCYQHHKTCQSLLINIYPLTPTSMESKANMRRFISYFFLYFDV